MSSLFIRLVVGFAVFASSIPSLSSEMSSGSRRIEQSQIKIGNDAEARNPFVTIDVEAINFDSSEKAVEAVSKIVAEKSQNKQTTVVLSSTSDEVIKATIENPALNYENLNVVPIGSLNQEARDLEGNSSLLEKQSQGRFRSLMQSYSNSVKSSLKNDKIGLMVLTYTTTAETLVWVHNSHMSEFERTGSIVYTVALALVFGINKDNWPKATRPFQDFFRKVLKFENDSTKKVKDLGVRFLGNLSLSMIVASGRVPFMSFDEIIETGLKLHYFSMPLLLSVVSTAAVFTWSEHIASINEKTHPIAKFVFRRVSEMRGIFLATFATTAALINPTQHGIMPWITVAGMGVLGGMIYAKSAEITDWVENLRLLQKANAKLGLRRSPLKIYRCEMLFSN